MADLAIKGDMPRASGLPYSTRRGRQELHAAAPGFAATASRGHASRQLEGHDQTGVEITKRVETTEAFEVERVWANDCANDGDGDVAGDLSIAIHQRPDLYRQDREERLIKAAGMRPGEENPAAKQRRHRLAINLSRSHTRSVRNMLLMKEASKGRIDRDHAFAWPAQNI